MKARRGVVARALDGRLDRSILSDVGVLVGAGMIGYALWQWSHPMAWLFTGAVIVSLSILSVLPPKKTPRSPKAEL